MGSQFHPGRPTGAAHGPQSRDILPRFLRLWRRTIIQARGFHAQLVQLILVPLQAWRVLNPAGFHIPGPNPRPLSGFQTLPSGIFRDWSSLLQLQALQPPYQRVHKTDPIHQPCWRFSLLPIAIRKAQQWVPKNRGDLLAWVPAFKAQFLEEFYWSKIQNWVCHREKILVNKIGNSRDIDFG